MEVIKPGALSLFQDEGRHGHQRLGVPVAGPMDETAHRLCNLVVGNPAGMASLEITLIGPVLRFTRPAAIALAGADLGARLNGTPVARYRPHVVRAGDILDFAGRQSGCRAYLAVYGGFGVEPVLGSRSTYVKGRLGPLGGRALKAGDGIPLMRPLRDGEHDLAACDRALWECVLYLPSELGLAWRADLRVVSGPQWKLFTEASREALLSAGFRILPQSDRMGFRLSGARLSTRSATQILSEATAAGAIQVPQGGDPIVLMADRQTMGGYPKIAVVATVDLSALAQRMPSEEIRFTLISLNEAQELDWRREEAFARLASSCAPIATILAGHAVADDTAIGP